MDSKTQLILINGADKSDSIESLDCSDTKCNIIYKSSPKVYAYNRSHVQIYALRRTIEPDSVIVTVNGETVDRIEQLLDFGDYYKIIDAHCSTIYPRSEVHLQENCLSDRTCASRFEYFRSIASAISLTVGDGFNILEHQYNKIQSVSRETALAEYLSDTPQVKQLKAPEVLIYPFGLNQSQKKAVENAFSSQISIIQGPPGTGKTQTILNIIANAVLNGKTVAVVSNNNSATRNVLEKLQKKHLDFLTAFLGKRENKTAFLEAQSECYPDMDGWLLSKEELPRVQARVQVLVQELDRQLNAKNRIAELEQELLELDAETHHFEDYYQSAQKELPPCALKLSAQKLLALWNELEAAAESGKKPGVLTKLRILFRYSRGAAALLSQPAGEAIPRLQKQFYQVRREELLREREELESSLEHGAFREKSEELADKSMQLFRSTLARRFHGRRPLFDSSAFYLDCDKFNREYPVILSTTYSIKNSLRPEHIYDYIIVDESSQVDLSTGVLALSCARNAVIVGDLMQLPNVLDDADRRTADTFYRDDFGENYRFTRHSLLSSAAAVWHDAPSVLLREHYRCHPKIINFCNQKFYDGRLIVMTEDHGEKDVLALYRTTPGNHARGRVNQREIDVIVREVLPRLHSTGFRDIGVITPYRDQVDALRRQLPPELEVDTVHKFQGREKDAIVLTSVDNTIGEFVDDAHMLNVAVSRAVDSLVVVTSQNPGNDRTNYGDLARYIAYHNFDVIDSRTYSVFDLLYREYARQRREFLKKHRRVSEYDSENLMFAVLEELLQQEDFREIGCAIHVSLSALIRDYSLLSPDEENYARNPLTHTDFLLFRKLDKSPVLAIEVDGTRFHEAGSKQAARDSKKDHIFSLCAIPLLRLRTDASGEKEKVEAALRDALKE